MSTLKKERFGWFLRHTSFFIWNINRFLAEFYVFRFLSICFRPYFFIISTEHKNVHIITPNVACAVKDGFINDHENSFTVGKLSGKSSFFSLKLASHTHD